MSKKESKFEVGQEVCIEPRKLDAVIKRKWYKDSIEEWIYALESNPTGQTHIYTEKNIS